MSEHMPEQAGGDAGSMDAAVAKVSDESAEPAAAAGPDTEARLIAPDHEAPKADAPKPESKPEASKAEAPKVEAPKAEPHESGKILIMSPGDRSWQGKTTGNPSEAETTASRRRIAAMAGVIALAAIAGAVSGALATAGVMHFASKDGPAPQAHGLEASVARIDADVLALKASVEHTSKMSLGQFNRASERLDRLEKAQAEPAAKLAKLTETVDKLRAAQAAAPASAAAKETTGSIAPAPAVAAAMPAPAPVAAPPKTEVGRLPTVEGWVLRDVGNGGALIEGRRGLYEVYAGDPVPGLGRIDAIRRQDGRWVVVTSKGLIVAR